MNAGDDKVKRLDENENLPKQQQQNEDATNVKGTSAEKEKLLIQEPSKKNLKRRKGKQFCFFISGTNMVLKRTSL